VRQEFKAHPTANDFLNPPQEDSAG
jgi:hypothetical protein